MRVVVAALWSWVFAVAAPLLVYILWDSVLLQSATAAVGGVVDTVAGCVLPTDVRLLYVLSASIFFRTAVLGLCHLVLNATFAFLGVVRTVAGCNFDRRLCRRSGCPEGPAHDDYMAPCYRAQAVRVGEGTTDTTIEWFGTVRCSGMWAWVTQGWSGLCGAAQRYLWLWDWNTRLGVPIWGWVCANPEGFSSSSASSFAAPAGG